MTKTIDDNMKQDTSTTTTTRKNRRAACDDNDNDSSNNHTSTGTFTNTTPNATNNGGNSHQPFKRPRLPSPFTRQAERFEEALNREIEEQEGALRMNEYRMLAVRALENEAHDRAFRDAMDVSSTYQQHQQYTSTQNPSVAAAAATAVDEDMDMDVDGDEYLNPQLEDHDGNGEGEEGQMVTPTVQETTQPTIPTQSGCLTSSLIGLDSNNNFTPISIPIPIPTPRTRPSNNNTNNSSNLDFTIFEDILPDRGGLLSFSPRPNRVASMLPSYLHYPYTNNHNNNQEVRAYHQDWDSDKENINSNIVAGTLHDPVGMITETEAESFSQVVDRSYHDHYDADADEDEMRLDYDEGSPAAAGEGGGGGEGGRWGSGVPTWRVESESEYADTEVDPDDLGLGVHDYANRRRRRYHRLRWQSRVLGSQDRGSVALNSSNVLVPRMLGEGLQGDGAGGAGGVAGRGRRGPRRL
ncbi:hypothetical protein BO83DRAFT_415596 [Aspergillus eucalypticola CBS 122712]|uniref:Uncharacterized protein n=1 Tax=Aspergillus eucalypticola (strain CBS 122712 / IBT 29274) TaxID=1448314 RepID=A0A317VXD8_ASPEC|nr:uncharacterized protein BO83DRAFT_415596 [Aspergillus eucalypticola CBS 122712]PWY77662.1 hypothetical protein BO83DRAFT_415596 [Aspergillus eucalypticola CBS 122712]